MSTRREIELLVVAHNKPLRESVVEMNIIILLRNLHPSFRPDYASRLMREGVITEAQAVEFTKIVGRRV